MTKIQPPSFKRHFQLLEFDTQLFGFQVAKLLPPKLSLTTLRTVLNQLKAQQVRLVYWLAATTNQKTHQAVAKLHGFLSSEQVTYLIDLRKISSLPKRAPEIKTYQAKTPTLAMKNLALHIGALSRFGTDPNMPKILWHKLYHAWITNSVKGTVADKVLVISHHNKIVGMITLSTKNTRGDIRLLAIDPKWHGKKLGTKLVYAAFNYFRNKGYNKVQVVTQKTNLPACALYEKCGFSQERRESFYHFWL